MVSSPSKLVEEWRGFNGLFFDDSVHNFEGCRDNTCVCLHTVVVGKGRAFHFNMQPDLFARNTEVGEKMREYADLLRVEAGMTPAQLEALTELYGGSEHPEFLFLDWDQTISSASGLFTDNQTWFRDMRAIDKQAAKSAMGLIFGDAKGTRLRQIIKLFNVAMKQVRAKALRFHIVTNQDDASAIQSLLRELRARWGLGPSPILVTGLAERRNIDKCAYIKLAMGKGKQNKCNADAGACLRRRTSN